MEPSRANFVSGLFKHSSSSIVLPKMNDTFIKFAWERGRHIVMCGWKDCARQWVQHSLNCLLWLGLIMQCIKPTILALGCNTVTLSHSPTWPVQGVTYHGDMWTLDAVDTEPAPFGTILQLHWPERRHRQCQCQRPRDDKRGSSGDKITGSFSIICVLGHVFPMHKQLWLVHTSRYSLQKPVDGGHQCILCLIWNLPWLLPSEGSLLGPGEGRMCWCRQRTLAIRIMTLSTPWELVLQKVPSEGS